MDGELLDRFFSPVEVHGDEQRIHIWVGVIALLLMGFLFGLKVTFGNRAI